MERPHKRALAHVSDDFGNYLRREELTLLLTTLIETSTSPLAAIEHDFAVDATGFSTTSYDRWFDKKWGREKKRQKWIKAHASTGVVTNVVAAIKVTDGNCNDSPEMPGLVRSTAERFEVREVSGDAAYLSHANLEAIEAVGAVPLGSRPGSGSMLSQKGAVEAAGLARQRLKRLCSPARGYGAIAPPRCSFAPCAASVMC